jgi:hypothetical protein
MAHRIDLETLRQAIEGAELASLLALYDDAAELRIIDCKSPPSRPRVLHGREQIAEYLDDICGRDMTHRLEQVVSSDGRLAFTEACEYADGTRVYCAAMAEIENGRIRRQTSVQAWDE